MSDETRWQEPNQLRHGQDYERVAHSPSRDEATALDAIFPTIVTAMWFRTECMALLYDNHTSCVSIAHSTGAPAATKSKKTVAAMMAAFLHSSLL
jgi:hypothetical protein